MFCEQSIYDKYMFIMKFVTLCDMGHDALGLLR